MSSYHKGNASFSNVVADDISVDWVPWTPTSLDNFMSVQSSSCKFWTITNMSIVAVDVTLRFALTTPPEHTSTAFNLPSTPDADDTFSTFMTLMHESVLQKRFRYVRATAGSVDEVPRLTVNSVFRPDTEYTLRGQLRYKPS